MKRQADGQLQLIPLHSAQAELAHAKLEPTNPAPPQPKAEEVLVTKRDGTTEEFNKARIALAIESAFKAVRDIAVDESLNPAMSEIVSGLAEKVSISLLDRVAQGGLLDVEYIQDSVENQMMCDGYLTEARRFILYREDRRKMREQKAHVEVIPEPPPAPAPAAAPAVDEKPNIESLLKVIYAEAILESAAGNDFAASHRRNFSYAIQDAVHSNQLAPELLMFDLDHLSEALRLERDELIAREGLEWLYGNCFARERDRCVETPQYFWMRLAMALAANEGEQKEARALEFYETLSTLQFVPSEKLLRVAGRSKAVVTRGSLFDDDIDAAATVAGHVNIAAHMEDGALDELLLYGTIATSVRLLDNAIDGSVHRLEIAAQRAAEHREIGLGVVGLEKALESAGLASAPEQADALVSRVAETVAYYATLSSALLSSERESYPAFDDSNWSLGALPFEGLKLSQPQSCAKDWLNVRAAVRQHGLRNGRLLGFVPSHAVEGIIGARMAAPLAVQLNRLGRFRNWVDGQIWITVPQALSAAELEQAQRMAGETGIRLYTPPVRVTISEPLIDAAAASKVLKSIEKGA